MENEEILCVFPEVHSEKKPTVYRISVNEEQKAKLLNFLFLS